MKTWKLVSGIISIVLFAFVIFQSCAAGISNSLAENGESGGSAGLIVAIILLAGGIVSIATRNGSKGGNIALIVLFALGALCGFTMAGSYADLNVWAAWCLICAVFAALVGIVVLFRPELWEAFWAICTDPVSLVLFLLSLAVAAVFVFLGPVKLMEQAERWFGGRRQ